MVRVIIQSRLSSTRLPAKALLPVAGVASVRLCAQRAANSGLDVVVAISESETDDEIEKNLRSADVRVTRGPQDDVLARFVLASWDMADQDVIVRLTADNLLPDGQFIEEILGQFSSGESRYLGTFSPVDGMPYGMSAEVFRVSDLRLADKNALDPYDREHVTPWIRRNVSVKHPSFEHVGSSWARLRCTLDSFDDYCRLLRVFEGVTDPVVETWRSLVEKLEIISRGDDGRCPFKVMQDGSIHSQLTLGTVQLGVEYGVANLSGKPSDHTSRALLERAIDSGVTSFDTARAYGESEQRIGHLLSLGYRDRVSVVTKLDLLESLPLDASTTLVDKLVDESVYHSCHNLKRETIDTLLLHRWEHYSAWGGAVWRRLNQLKDLGVIGKLGVSVYLPEQAIEAIKDPLVTHVQIPHNILDWRWRDARFLNAVARRADVVWHVRSVYLQGLLLLTADKWPLILDVDPETICAKIDAMADEFGRSGRADLCMAYIRSLPWVTSLVVGMESIAQLEQNLSLMRQPKLKEKEVAMIEQLFSDMPPNLLNPAKWKA